MKRITIECTRHKTADIISEVVNNLMVGVIHISERELHQVARDGYELTTVWIETVGDDPTYQIPKVDPAQLEMFDKDDQRGNV